MGKSNFERMISLVDEVFATRRDPDQISMNEAQREKLARLHPATLTQQSDENGPVAWILVFPTTRELMDKFVEGTLSERNLLAETPFDVAYTALYLCSALVLPEYRRKGLARRLTIDAVRSIQRTYPIEVLFFWPFTREGDLLAKSVAAELRLPLRERRR
ncbi:MAG TPA: hypothetical protein VF889_01095 [Bacteroidota bacterium]